MACSRISPMNNSGMPDRNDATPRDREDSPAVDRDTVNSRKPRRGARRRWGGRLVAMGAFLLLAGGVSLGAWGHHSRQQDVMATAERQRDFVPSLRVATVVANPAMVSVTLPATTAAFAQANIYARATGYIGKRNVDIGDRVKQGDLLVELAVPELDDQRFSRTNRRSNSSTRRWTR